MVPSPWRDGPKEPLGLLDPLQAFLRLSVFGKIANA
jgi:hypothetical protein